jgi:mono/diheme cytochrome c family protein
MNAKLLTFLLVLFASFSAWATPPVEEGKSIFTTRCAGCHSITKVLTGPALAGVDERRSMDWIINFVHSSQKMVKAGDKDAVAVFEKFNKIPMPDHTDLTDENIKNIVAYIKTEKEAAATAATAPAETPSAKRPGYLSLATDNYGLLLTYLALGALLISTLIFAYQVKGLKRRMDQEQV